MFKPRGTTGGLTTVHSHESNLAQMIERVVDSDPARSGVIAELASECQSRTVARPTEACWHFLQGRYLMACGDPLDARDALERAAVLAPRDPRITVHLALWYEAAVLAATGATQNVELPSAAGPDLSASAARFAKIDEPLTVDEMAQRAIELFDATLRFRLPSRDRKFVKRHLEVVRRSASDEDVRVHHRRLLRAV